jgi:hypothetical protein
MGRTAPYARSFPPHAPPRARRPGLLPLLPALCVFLVLGLGAPASAPPWDLAAADRYCHKLDIREDVGEAIALAARPPPHATPSSSPAPSSPSPPPSAPSACAPSTDGFAPARLRRARPADRGPAALSRPRRPVPWGRDVVRLPRGRSSDRPRTSGGPAGERGRECRAERMPRKTVDREPAGPVSRCGSLRRFGKHVLVP